jgi:hypothetical protein
MRKMYFFLLSCLLLSIFNIKSQNNCHECYSSKYVHGNSLGFLTGYSAGGLRGYSGGLYTGYTGRAYGYTTAKHCRCINR